MFPPRPSSMLSITFVLPLLLAAAARAARSSPGRAYPAFSMAGINDGGAACSAFVARTTITHRRKNLDILGCGWEGTRPVAGLTSESSADSRGRRVATTLCHAPHPQLKLLRAPRFHRPRLVGRMSPSDDVDSGEEDDFGVHRPPGGDDDDDDVNGKGSSAATSGSEEEEMFERRLAEKAERAITMRETVGKSSQNRSRFDLRTALFCAGLAFDAYSEPSNSSRWEKGSKGLNVAFQSAAYTRSLYKGLVEVTAHNCTDLPDEDDAAESVLSGGGVDAYLLVAVAEGKMTEDVDHVEKERYSAGVLGLQGSAHVGRTRTAWSNVDERQGAINLKKYGKGAYYIPSSWGRGGQAIWREPPFYLYVSEPKDARLVFTVMDEDVVGEDSVIGSAYRKLSSFFPFAGMKDPLKAVKLAIVAKLKKQQRTQSGCEPVEFDDLTGLDLAKQIVQSWEGTIKLTTKPRKKDKGGQVAIGMAAGAVVAGPAGAAVGGLIGNLLEGDVRGKIGVGLRYLPIPNVETRRQRYKVKGGLPGVDWGHMYERYIQRLKETDPSLEADYDIAGDDLEFCTFVTHDDTGCSCAVYRSLERKMIAISFRGTCAPKDLITDASIIQTPWVEGEDPEKEGVPKVHVGFRKSLNSISRRLKELVLAAVLPGETLSQYDVYITGHSLGGALATLFATDIAEYGMDAGRSLPQLEPSEPWWSALVSRFSGTDKTIRESSAPPRPKKLRLYSFGSPRVGNDDFVGKFDSLQGNGLDEAYRVVNDADIVARLPRTINALMFGNIGYDHCGATCLISLPRVSKEKDSQNRDASEVPMLWVEGESSDDSCPVRDGTPLTSPLAAGMLLGDLFIGVKNITEMSSPENVKSTVLKNTDVTNLASKWTFLAGKMTESVTGRLQKLSASDITSIFGVKQDYAAREAKIIQSVLSGEAIAHHMENEYYGAMGRACGFIAVVGEELMEVSGSQEWKKEMEIFEEEHNGLNNEFPGEVATERGKHERRLTKSPEGEFAIWDAQLDAWEKEVNES